MKKPKTYAEAVAFLEKRRTELRIKGHKLIRSRSGCESTYQRGDCECGAWRFNGWTESTRSVRVSHNTHLRQIYLKPFKYAERAEQPAAPANCYEAASAISKRLQQWAGEPRSPWDGSTLE